MVTYSSSFRDFLRLSESKVASILSRTLYKEANRFPSFKSNIVTNSQIDYITFRNDGSISFLPNGKEHIANDSGDWSRTNRQNGRPAKVIRKLFTEKGLKLFKESDFESFCNQYKSSFCDDLKFEIWESDRIGEVYDMERADGDSSLDGSCMNGGSDYLDIYTHCDKLRIVVLLKKHIDCYGNDCYLLAGRALLWKIDNDITFMDRFFVAQDYMYEMMKEFAETNGFYYKRYYKTYDHKTEMITPSGDAEHFKWKIYLDTDGSSHPYIDTFHYGGDGWISNYRDGCYTYKKTGGERQVGEDDAYDQIDNVCITTEDAVEIEIGQHAGRITHINNAVLIGGRYYYKYSDRVVKIEDNWYDTESDDVMEVNGLWYLEEDTCYSEFTNETHLMDDCVYSEKHSTYIPKEDAVKLDGKYYHKYDINKVN